MKQVLVRGGKVEVLEVPAPAAAPGRALVSTAFSLISAGTEMAALGATGRGPLQRAAAHPSPVKRLGEILREEGMGGLVRRWGASPAGQELAELGYSASGVIRERGEGVALDPGTRVACAGSQFAHHAELISVPENLLARIPEEVSLEEAAFGTLGAIALHAFRRSEARLGESVAVLGLGLVGLLGAQIARSAGCRVAAFDPVPERVDLARSLGIEGARTLSQCDPEAEVNALTRGEGADAVLIFAGSTTNEPLTRALRLARKKGKVVVVGAIGMEVDRSPFYAKELDLLISTSYGPGRYDPEYEEKGHDYPFAYVRWTEGRNLQAVLELMSSGQLRVKPLIERIWPVSRAPEAYQALQIPGRRPAVLLRYPGDFSSPSEALSSRTVNLRVVKPIRDEVGVALVGPGSFMKEVFVPALRRQPRTRLLWVVARTGGSARAAAERFEAAVASTDLTQALLDERVHLVVIGTRHHLHADQTSRALEAGKAVFVEKPLCLNRAELDRIREARRRSGGLLAVGFNRRYAPLVREMKRQLQLLPGPRVIQIRVNAGRLPRDHWTQDPGVGGGRLLGEGCHFIDLIPFLAGSPISCIQVGVGATLPERRPVSDNFALNLEMTDGSVGSLVYTSLGDASLPKERVEVHAGGCSMVLDDFRDLLVHRGGTSRKTSGSRDKGIEAEIAALSAAVRGEASDLMSWEEIEATTEWTLRAQALLEKKE